MSYGNYQGLNMDIVNLTQHSITEVTTGQTFPPSGRVVRVRTASRLVRTHQCCPIYDYNTEEIVGLPEAKENTLYIVSALALNAVPAERTDVVAPGAIHRDENKRPIGCFGFRQR